MRICFVWTVLSVSNMSRAVHQDAQVFIQHPRQEMLSPILKCLGSGHVQSNNETTNSPSCWLTSAPGSFLFRFYDPSPKDWMMGYFGPCPNKHLTYALALIHSGNSSTEVRKCALLQVALHLNARQQFQHSGCAKNRDWPNLLHRMIKFWFCLLAITLWLDCSSSECGASAKKTPTEPTHLANFDLTQRDSRCKINMDHFWKN